MLPIRAKGQEFCYNLMHKLLISFVFWRKLNDIHPVEMSNFFYHIKMHHGLYKLTVPDPILGNDDGVKLWV